MKNKEKVFLTGASGSMGHEAFKVLWNKKDIQGNRKYDIVLLLRPSEKNKKMFRKYAKEAKLPEIPGAGIVENEEESFKIVWGDIRNYDDVREAIKGVDAVLSPMAFISPAADHHPEMAKAVNTQGMEYIIKAIGEEPNGNEHIRLITVGTVAAYGDRQPPAHRGRVGDPLIPSVFDMYAITKVAGERAVLESDIKYWAHIRQTFIMIPDLFGLADPIMFHQPIDSFMEAITAKDAGRGLVNALDIPYESDFWRRVYNMGGGPSCRITYLDFMNVTYKLLNINYKNVFERRWFALRNFHMMYFEDSEELNKYLHHYGQSLEDFTKDVWKHMPFGLKITAKLNKIFPPFRKMVEKATYKKLKKLASQKDGTLYWYEHKKDLRIKAFYGSYEKYEQIPDWNEDLPGGVMGNPEPNAMKIEYGFDINKKNLNLSDLQTAAEFRGGKCLTSNWSADLYEKVEWECAFGHKFLMKPYTALKAGHWCPKCDPPPWEYDKIAKKNKFIAQIWYSHHDKDENTSYPPLTYDD